MGYGSTKPFWVGDPRVIAMVMNGDVATGVAVQGNSECVNVDLLGLWTSELSPKKWRGFGITGRQYAGTEPEPPFGQGPAGIIVAEGSPQYPLTPIGPTNVQNYWLGSTSERKFTQTWTGQFVPWISRVQYCASAEIAPASYQNRTRHGDLRKDGVDYFHNRAYHIRIVWLKTPNGVDGKFEFTGLVSPPLEALPAVNINFFSAQPTVAWADLAVPAASMDDPLRNMQWGLCGKNGAVVPVNAVTNLIGTVCTFDDSPTGTFFIDASEAGTTLSEAVAAATASELPWDAANAMGITHLMNARFVNTTYNTAGTVADACAALHNKAKARGIKYLILTSFWDVVATPNKANVPPFDFNNLQAYEQGFAMYAETNPDCVFINTFAYGGTYRKLVQEGAFNNGDPHPVQPEGFRRWVNDFNSIAWMATNAVDDVVNLSDTAVEEVAAALVPMLRENGAGDIPVTEDGARPVCTVDGVDSVPGCMIVVDNQGNPIDNATIVAYTSSDYYSERTGVENKRGTTYTDSLGRWIRPLMLEPGNYVVTIHAPNRRVQAQTIALYIE